MISSIFVQRIDWNGIIVEISYEPQWLNMTDLAGKAMAHLAIRSVAPERAPLPITETGYLSHFVLACEVTEQGGPNAYVRAWLDSMAASKIWKDQQEAARQMSFL